MIACPEIIKTRIVEKDEEVSEVLSVVHGEIDNLVLYRSHIKSNTKEN